MKPLRRLVFFLPLPLFFFICFAPSIASAHPLSQGSLQIEIHRDAVLVRARVTVEEMTITNRATSASASVDPFAASDSAAYEQHAAYLASHLQVIADGARLPGGVSSVEPPENAQPALSEKATYELIYPLPSKAPPSSRIEIKSDVLSDGNFSPGFKWEVTYIVQASIEGGHESQTHLLTGSDPVLLRCDWTTHSLANAAQPAGQSTSARRQIFVEYFWHGIHHIFNRADPGYDHLLFVSALALGATRLWELFKLVTTFTVAHTLTLTLAALNLVHVSERIVEPLIALSIVCVAVENLIWTGRSHQGLRLAAAFFFGLFNGLGFAGALLEAMHGMSGSLVLPAILAFSIGVEAAHQMVVVPLFFLLKLARQTRSDPVERSRFGHLTQRVGSAAISLAGLFYLFVALRPSFAS